MSNLSDCFERPMVEITPVVGGYVASVRVPYDDGEDGDVEIKPIVSTNLDTLLTIVKRVIKENQHEWRKKDWGDIPAETAKKKSTRKQ